MKMPVRKYADAAEQIERDLRDTSIELIKTALMRLHFQGVKAGAVCLQRFGARKTFRISRVDIHGGRRGACALHVAIYGHQLRADGSFGTHVHYIGRPTDLDAVG